MIGITKIMKLIILLFCTTLISPVISREVALNNSFLLAYNEGPEDITTEEIMYRSRRSTVGPIELKVKFYLFTRQNEEPIELLPNDPLLLKNSPFDVNKPTKILIHGLFGSLRRPFIQEIKRSYLEVEDVNVIAVDWSPIAWSINYYSIVNKVPDVGLYVAGLLEFLVAEGCDPKTFHIIGHSLGAHVAGYAGASLKGKISRITGLDPAKPCFHNVDPSNRLDSTDAIFVDCIHTCGGLLGLLEPICDADFYPNGGKNTQPGCHIFDLGRCSHKRSHEYFAESIVPEHKFPSLLCGDLSEELYRCEETDILMGNYARPSARGIYYVHTNIKFPYAVIH